MPDRRVAATVWVGMSLGGVGVIVGTFLPWAVSGRVRRNVFELAEVAGRLGTLGTLPLGVAFVIPLLCAIPTLLLAMRLVRTAGLVAALVSIGALAGSGSALVNAGARQGGMIEISVTGPVVTAAAALLLLVAALATVRWGRSARRAGHVPGTTTTPPFAPHERDATP